MLTHKKILSVKPYYRICTRYSLATGGSWEMKMSNTYSTKQWSYLPKMPNLTFHFKFRVLNAECKFVTRNLVNPDLAIKSNFQPPQITEAQ